MSHSGNKGFVSVAPGCAHAGQQPSATHCTWHAQQARQQRRCVPSSCSKTCDNSGWSTEQQQSALEALRPLGVQLLWDRLPPLVGQVLHSKVQQSARLRGRLGLPGPHGWSASGAHAGAHACCDRADSRQQTARSPICELADLLEARQLDGRGRGVARRRACRQGCRSKQQLPPRLGAAAWLACRLRARISGINWPSHFSATKQTGGAAASAVPPWLLQRTATRRRGTGAAAAAAALVKQAPRRAATLLRLP